MNPSTSTTTWLRVALALFGVFLSAQAAWILLAERQRLNHIRFPVDGKTATIEECRTFVSRSHETSLLQLRSVVGCARARIVFIDPADDWPDEYRLLT